MTIDLNTVGIFVNIVVTVGGIIKVYVEFEKRLVKLEVKGEQVKEELKFIKDKIEKRHLREVNA